MNSNEYIKNNLKLFEHALLKCLPFANKKKCNEKIEKYRNRIAESLKYLTFGEKQAKEISKKCGKHTYLCDYVTVASMHSTIGSYVSIADNVSIGTTHHPVDFLSTHPFCYFEMMKLKNSKQIPFEYNTPCHIGNDVWIGKSAIIMDGITVGDGAIIGAGAIVTHDVPPYAIVGGVPAKIIRYRFKEEIIKDLLELKWWELDEELIGKFPFDDIEKCIEQLKAIRNVK